MGERHRGGGYPRDAEPHLGATDDLPGGEVSGQKTITGKCEEVSERGEWVTFHVDVGTQYPVKLSTKLLPLVELGRAAVKSGNAFDWTYTESQGKENPHKPGTFFTNRYLEAVEPAGSVPTPAAPAQGGQMSKEEWARKDSAIHKMACIKTAADALKHTLPSGQGSELTTEDLNQYLARVTHLSLAWHRQVLAERDDPTGESVPF
jgi:hypothetical protein